VEKVISVIFPNKFLFRIIPLAKQNWSNPETSSEIYLIPQAKINICHNAKNQRKKSVELRVVSREQSEADCSGHISSAIKKRGSKPHVAILHWGRGRMRSERQESAAPSRTLLQRPVSVAVLVGQETGENPPFGLSPQV